MFHENIPIEQAYDNFLQFYQSTLRNCTIQYAVVLAMLRAIPVPNKANMSSELINYPSTNLAAKKFDNESHATLSMYNFILSRQ